MQRFIEARGIASKKMSTRLAMLHDLERQDTQPQGPSTRSSEKSTSYLDGLRGLAALFVFFQHYIGPFDLNKHEHGFGENGHYYQFASFPFLRVIFAGGSAAVAVFFVLSGYVLSKSPLKLLRNEKCEGLASRLLSAALRRPIRLYLPTLAITLIWAMMLHAPFGLVQELPWTQRKGLGVFSELRHWIVESVAFFNPFQTHGSNHAWYTYSLVAWTIPIELKGSMLVFALMALGGFGRLPLLVNLSALAISTIILLHVAKWTMACFIAGLFLAWIDSYSIDVDFAARRLSRRAQSIIWNATFFIGWYLLSEPSHDEHPEYSFDTPGWHWLSLLIPSAYDKYQYYRYWHSWGAILLVYSTLRIRWLQLFLDTRPLRYLGKVSFMLYLVHLPVLAILGLRIAASFGTVVDGLPRSTWDDRLHIPDFGPIGLNSRWLASLAITLPVCLVVADIGTRLLDLPSVQAGKWLVRRLGLEKNASGKTETEEAEEEHVRLMPIEA